MASSTDALPLSSPRPQGREVAVVSPPTFIENIAVRPNGRLLLSTFTSKLYTIDPSVPDAKLEVALEFPEVNALLGMAEIAPDVFAIGAGLKSAPFQFEDAMKVFVVSFRDDGSANIDKKIDGPPGLKINGMCALPANPKVVLCAQSFTGSIYRVDTSTGAIDEVFTDQSLAMDTTRQTVPCGVNGIRAVGSHLYFANSAKGLFCRVPLAADGSTSGDVEILARFPGETSFSAAYDDFAITNDASTVYVATHPSRVIKVDIATGKQEVFYDGSGGVELIAPTSAALSRDGKLLYVSTGGIKMNGAAPEMLGGQVVELRLP